MFRFTGGEICIPGFPACPAENVHLDQSVRPQQAQQTGSSKVGIHAEGLVNVKSCGLYNRENISRNPGPLL